MKNPKKKKFPQKKRKKKINRKKHNSQRERFVHDCKGKSGATRAECWRKRSLYNPYKHSKQSACNKTQNEQDRSKNCKEEPLIFTINKQKPKNPKSNSKSKL